MAQVRSTTDKQDRKLLGVRIDRDLHRQVRTRAFLEDRPLAELVRDALQRYLKTPAAGDEGAA